MVAVGWLYFQKKENGAVYFLKRTNIWKYEEYKDLSWKCTPLLTKTFFAYTEDEVPGSGWI